MITKKLKKTQSPDSLPLHALATHACVCVNMIWLKMCTFLIGMEIGI